MVISASFPGSTLPFRSSSLRENLRGFLARLADEHGVLPTSAADGKPLWSFVHGNWALDNSRGDGRWCGVNNELRILREMGCYADFTLPSAPSDTQTSTVNSLYYATDDPVRPKSHDTGDPLRVGGSPRGDLMIVQGPLCLRWKWRGPVPVPAIENGDVRAGNPPTPERIDAWVRTGVHVGGRPEWVFVKVHTHGTQDRDIDALLGPPVARMFEHLEFGSLATGTDVRGDDQGVGSPGLVQHAAILSRPYVTQEAAPPQQPGGELFPPMIKHFSPELQAKVEAVLTEANQFVANDRAWACYYDPLAGSVEVLGVVGDVKADQRDAKKDLKPGQRLTLDSSAAGWAVRHRKPRVDHDLASTQGALSRSQTTL